MDENKIVAIRWDMCRTCGEEGDVNIYDERGIELQLEEKINAYLPITVSSKDDLPLFLCTTCIERLEGCHHLVVSCLETDAKLKQVSTAVEFCDVQEEAFESPINDENITEVLVETTEETDNENFSIIIIPEGSEKETVVAVSTILNDGKENEDVEPKKSRGNSQNSKQKRSRSVDTDGNESEASLSENRKSEKRRQVKDVFTCIRCKFRTSSREEYAEHLKNYFETDSVDISCRSCEERFDDIDNFIDHTRNCPRKSQSKRRIDCKVCGKTLANTNSLAIHLRMHRDERPYTCTHCNKGFNQISAWKTHVLTHTGERPHRCSYCNKGFTTKMSMVIHERIHTGERPFTCKTCGAKFRCHGNLAQHEAIHIGARPFMCQVCGKLFSRPDRVRIHMRTHTGERPYPCPICGRAFSQKGDMMKHTNTHNRKGNVKVTQLKNKDDDRQTQLRSVSAWLQRINDREGRQEDGDGEVDEETAEGRKRMVKEEGLSEDETVAGD